MDNKHLDNKFENKPIYSIKKSKTLVYSSIAALILFLGVAVYKTYPDIKEGYQNFKYELANFCSEITKPKNYLK